MNDVVSTAVSVAAVLVSFPLALVAARQPLTLMLFPLRSCQSIAEVTAQRLDLNRFTKHILVMGQSSQRWDQVEFLPCLRTLVFLFFSALSALPC